MKSIDLEFDGDFHSLMMALFMEKPFTIKRKEKDPVTVCSRLFQGVTVSGECEGIGMASSSTSYVVFPVELPSFGNIRAKLVIYFNIEDRNGTPVFVKHKRITGGVVKLQIEIK